MSSSQRKKGVPDTIASDPDAKAAREYEEQHSYMQTVNKFRPAIKWSILFAITIVGEGYDLALMGNFFSLAQFQNLFGHSSGRGAAKEIPALWQSMILTSSQAGQVSAMYFAGLSMDKYGYRKTMMVSLGTVIVFLFVNFFATAVLPTRGYNAGLGMIAGGSFLLGVPWGSFQACVLAYASDISPLKLRPALTTFISMCWIFGQLFSTAAIKTVTTIQDNDVLAYRLPVALQWIWPIPILICVFLAPESPWWLIRQSRPDLARRSLNRLNKDAAYPVDGQVKVLELTNDQEKNYDNESEITYLECFRGINLRRTMIVVTTNLTQQLCGSALMFYSAKLYQKAGMSSSKSYDFTLIQYAIGIICIVTSWPLMKYIGRRTIWLWGLGVAVVLMAGVGVLGFFNDAHVAIPWVIAVLLVIFTGVYNLSIGPLAYAINPEIPSTRQKAKTLVIGRVAYLIAGQFNMWLLPRMLEDVPNGWGLGPRAAMVYSGINAVFWGWAYFCLPEVRGRPQADMDELFKRKISARKFSQADIE
ncbi:Putative major facilitator, sugar transporter, major facilitator superfamily [Colletotrichum destructivum]|uniref:Major facilitator, sugar transporter, major facilitator superfamily n=1 Tax=Colletotrichum destructivum TaxID=34406 RepID=A0AAX4HWV1_9PEZI|nr:Putative major facilitator, sugar transporter, major facilitator superfamily [Colletotrichum destructivum]